MSPMALPRLLNRTRRPFISTPPKHRTLPPPAALCCRKPSTCPPRQRVWSAAITPGPKRTCSSAQKKVYLHLCPECLRLLVDPKCGSRSTTTAPNLFAYIPGKPWALWRSSPSLTLHHHQPLPVHIAHILSSHTCRPPSSSSLKALFQVIQRHY